MRYTKKAYKLKLVSIIVIQSIIRVLICKNYIVRLRRYNAASTIQSYRKMLKQYKRFNKLKKASISIQSIARMYIKHMRYIILRDQARARSDLKNRSFYSLILIIDSYY
jgi:myosin heavy subunit